MKALTLILCVLANSAFSQILVNEKDTLQLNGKTIQHKQLWIQPIEDEIQQRFQIGRSEEQQENDAEIIIRQSDQIKDLRFIIAQRENQVDSVMNFVYRQNQSLLQLSDQVYQLEKQNNQTKLFNQVTIGGVALSVALILLK